MTNALRLAVLSDLHVNRSASKRSWKNFKEALDAVSHARIDHVVLAGDTFDCGTAFDDDRDAVREALDDAGWWRADKLTVVVGNHDVFETPHHGASMADWTKVALRTLDAAAGETYESFCEWARDLVKRGDRLDDLDLFPFAKQVDHLVLFANDTTGPNTLYSTNGYWDDEDDDNLRRVRARGLRRVLAIHHPPQESTEKNLIMQATTGYSFGFPEEEFERLEQFLDDQEIEAVVCGHIHDNGEEPYQWSVGDGTRAYMMGRTGGCHGVERCFGVLEVPERGRLTWKVRHF